MGGMRSGTLITFEGIDGCGKTTQLKLVEEYLTGAGYRVLTTREPGGTPLGRQIREALLGGEKGSVDPLAELLLYAADRAQHVRQLVLPALEEGKVVLSDRFFDATVAYQGYGRGFSLDLIDRLNDLATGGLKPAMTLLYDLEVEEALKRTRERHNEAAPEAAMDRLDREPGEFHRRVREGYLSLAARESSRFRLIPAAGSIDEIFPVTIRLVREAIEAEA